MGIHVHRKGAPRDMCGCCDLRARLDALYERTHGAVLSINGITPDGQGAITLELLEQAAVQGLIDDYIEPMQDRLDEMDRTLTEGLAPVIEVLDRNLREVRDTYPGLIQDNHDYIAAVADDLSGNYTRSSDIARLYATKVELSQYAKRTDITGLLDDAVLKTGNGAPQVITGSGGLMLQGDLSVGGDITGSSDTYLHFDTVQQLEVAGMTVKKDGAITRLSNANGISVNGLYMSDMVSTIKTTPQTMNGDLIVNGRSLSKAVIANFDGQEITNKVVKSNNRPQLSLQGNAGIYVDLHFKNGNGEKKLTFNSKDILIANPTENADSSAIVNKNYVSATDGTNNLLHTSANETKSGNLVFLDGTYVVSPMVRGIALTSPQNTHRLYMHLGKKADASNPWRINMIICGRNGLSMIHWEGYQGNVSHVEHIDAKVDSTNVTRFNLLSRGTEDYLSVHSGNYSNRPNIIIMMCIRGTAVTQPEYMTSDLYNSETDTFTRILEL